MSLMQIYRSGRLGGSQHMVTGLQGKWKLPCPYRNVKSVSPAACHSGATEEK